MLRNKPVNSFLSSFTTDMLKNNNTTMKPESNSLSQYKASVLKAAAANKNTESQINNGTTKENADIIIEENNIEASNQNNSQEKSTTLNKIQKFNEDSEDYTSHKFNSNINSKLKNKSKMKVIKEDINEDKDKIETMEMTTPISEKVRQIGGVSESDGLVMRDTGGRRKIRKHKSKKKDYKEVSFDEENGCGQKNGSNESNSEDAHREKKRQEERDFNPKRTIFVSNLSRILTKKTLANLFIDELGSGDIFELRIRTFSTFVNVKNKNQNKEIEKEDDDRTRRKLKLRRQKNYAFIEFPYDIDFEKLKGKYDRRILIDREIYINKALTTQEIAERKNIKYENKMKNNNTKLKTNDQASFTRDGNKDTKPEDKSVNKNKSTDTLFVKGIPYFATKREIAHFFKTEEELVTLLMQKMKISDSGDIFYSRKKNIGKAFIKFNGCSTDIEEQVDRFNGKIFQDRKLSITIASDKKHFSAEGVY
ncbi:hypothetical protein TBLA_0G00700 [Henningerozyma blattae CBS 6284]|uniref:RRM domain-containing protein n=1 Tax=Henningerozyma blattae (strain ATCC 34711 / CBS 6284 / DSM 70876 / NBRC 10599 / NRRL Y-10934 / UCD 77-7) TaxID=1071380 RepID=I2H6L5_HENB6|nr:hypothetical protein TBLA_0G00700 [Tetrapisispora blattae CBS 6284]CCH62017.1 hypothetical protein TBLA_0G00700 [Tetrapisispora blattae CBS 6284]